MRRILLFGAQGQVATELRHELSTLGALTVVGRHTEPEALDFREPQRLRGLIERMAPDVVVNAAAYTAVDLAETQEADAYLVNAVAPGVMAEATRACGALLVHYSTDYVFAGASERPWLETDPVGPLCAYGRTKLAGEEAIRAVGGAHLILRTSWVYGLHGHNFMRTMRRLARERDTLRVVADQIGAPTWSRHIAQATAQMLCQLNDAQRQQALSGTYHLSSAGQGSWFDFAQRIIDHQSRHEQLAVRELLPISSADYPVPARRPAWSVLDGGKLHRQFGIRLPHWEEALAQVQNILDQDAL